MLGEAAYSLKLENPAWGQETEHSEQSNLLIRSSLACTRGHPRVSEPSLLWRAGRGGALLPSGPPHSASLRKCFQTLQACEVSRCWRGPRVLCLKSSWIL